MFIRIDQTLVSAMKDERAAYLAKEYRVAQQGGDFFDRCADRIAQWASKIVANISTGTDRGESGTLMPST